MKVERKTIAPSPPPVEVVVTMTEGEAKGLRDDLEEAAGLFGFHPPHGTTQLWLALLEMFPKEAPR